MPKHVFINIKELIQVRPLPERPLIKSDLGVLPTIENAFLIIENNRVIGFGSMVDFNHEEFKNELIEDLSGKFVLPSFCDSHTHAVFAAPRETEFVDKIKGLSYQQIASRGGGILNSANHVSNIPEEELFNRSLARVKSIIQGGTGALEIKSGYGLSLANELKILRVIKEIKKQVDIPIKTTFLAAHAIPKEFIGRKVEFINEIVSKWIPVVVKEGLADYIDLFCETGYFDPEDIEIFSKAIQHTPLKLKVHVNQFNAIGGIDTAVRNKAVSVDHLEVMNEADYLALQNGNTMATLLPACSFYLNLPYAPARTLVDKGVPIALASDFNPGSSPTHNLFFVWSLGCIQMKLTPEEALNALTINAAFAMGLERTHGAIFQGYAGKLLVTKEAPTMAYFPYAFAENHIDKILN